MTKFFLYARKSTDEPDRQILSIEAQIAELKEFAIKERLEIAETFIESQTAKEPGRSIFNRMLEKIELGEAQGIIAWHLDRLARNSVDGGKIIYLLDVNKIEALKFPTFWFEPTPQGKFMLNIAFGQSKYYVDNLSENVKRGLRQKVRNGEQSGVAPTGYLNNRLTKKMVKDPERYLLVQKLFEIYSTGKYSLKEVRNIIAEQGLKSRNEKVLSISNIQVILKNSFYYGVFVFNGELWQGTHEPIIAKKLFDKVQDILKDKSRPKKRSQIAYPFRGLLKCGECGCAITSETKKGHNYYRCTKKKIACSQKYLREERLSEQISNILQKVSLPDSWKNIIIAELDKEKNQTDRGDFSFVQNLKTEIKLCDGKLDNLLDAKLENLITTEEYATKKQKILSQKMDCAEKLKDFERKGNCWLERAKQFILEANQAQIIASGENADNKSGWLKKVGSNLVLENQKIRFTTNEPWKIIENLPVAPIPARRAGGENLAVLLDYTLVLAGVEAVRTWFITNRQVIYIPNLKPKEVQR
jgi:DNA invertase Pin-like site-specific DNA recombinase